LLAWALDGVGAWGRYVRRFPRAGSRPYRPVAPGYATSGADLIWRARPDLIVMEPITTLHNRPTLYPPRCQSRHRSEVITMGEILSKFVQKMGLGLAAAVACAGH
jgi:hypothetical protein